MAILSYWVYVCVFLSCMLPVCMLLDAGLDWSYNETSWGKAGSPCIEGKMQSPVDLRDWVNDGMLRAIDFSEEYQVAPAEMVMEHMGKTVQMVIPDVDMTISGGPMASTFSFLQLHFHWGRNNSLGSEHTVNGHSYPQEFHIVHWNSGKYPTVTEAMKHKDGLVVLGIFTAVDERKNEKINYELEMITHYFDNIRQIGENITVPFTFPVYNLIPTNKQYFTYEGSLTTPNCDEIVLWIVFTEPIYIPHARMEAFRKFVEKDVFLTATHRPVQPINQRTIRLSPMFATTAISYKEPLLSEGAVFKCDETEQEPVKYVEMLDIVESRQETKLKPFRLTSSGNATWLLYRQKDKVGLKPSPSSPIPLLEGGGLDNPHHLHDVVFLYSGDELLYKSPHTFNKSNSPLEIHMIFYDSYKYKSFAQAKEKRNFLIVAIPAKHSDDLKTPFSSLDGSLVKLLESEHRHVSEAEEEEEYFFEQTPQYKTPQHKTVQRRTPLNPFPQPLESQLHDEYIEIPERSVAKSFLVTLLRTDVGYYKYYGPATFPHCSMSVQWIVLTDSIPVNLRTSKLLRQIRLEFPYEIMPSQKDRHISQILLYKPTGKSTATRTVEACMGVIVMVLVLAMF